MLVIHMNGTQTRLEAEAEIFNALAHPSRLEILELLMDGEACVCHIQAMLDQRQAYVSQHLNVLRQAGLVTNRKEGLRVYYKISDPGLVAVLNQVKIFLENLGKWQPGLLDDSVLIEKKKPCGCPQCSTQAEIQAAISPQV
jgi:DNA-binding transcriptional ArsR family regulator